MKVLSRAEASKYLGISIETLKRRIKDGTIPTHRLGNRILLTQEEIDKVLMKEADKENADNGNH